MTSRVLNVYIKNKEPFNSYYVDYLCVDKNKRKQNIEKRVYLTSLSTYSKGLCDFFIIPIDPKKIKDINRCQKIIF